MADLKYYDIIKKPIITEQTMNDMTSKKYSFYVNPKATKIQIKEAIEKMFENTKVNYINTMNVRGKKRRKGYIVGKTPDRKKAIVQLTKESKEIELFQSM